GNHAQFGWYGDQAGDNPASISREKQQQRIIESTRQIVDIVN
ncbi:MAG TPA: alpha/beta hydrolase, partial [Anaerolineales bacterium]|nr:alpha/beta hydrolase [Anaerolineales bacterium]